MLGRGLRPICSAHPVPRVGSRQGRAKAMDSNRGACPTGVAALEGYNHGVQNPSASALPDSQTSPVSLKVMTVNTHKGFAALNRRFILPELREAVRTIGADLVFLQEVLGTHSRHS